MKARIIAVQAIWLCVLVCSPDGRGEDRIAQPAAEQQGLPAVPAVVFRAKAVLKRYSYSIDGVTIDWTTSAELPDSDDDFVVDEQSDVEQFRIADSSIDCLMFGDGFDPAVPDERLAMLLQERVTELDRICDLTHVQKQKILLAGRGDIQRYIHRADQLRKMYREKFVDGKDFRAQYTMVQTLCRDAHNNGRNPYEGPFFEHSLFAKMMHSCLTASQWDVLKRTKFLSSATIPPDPDLRSWVKIKVELFEPE